MTLCVGLFTFTQSCTAYGLRCLLHLRGGARGLQVSLPLNFDFIYHIKPDHKLRYTFNKSYSTLVKGLL